MNKEVLSTYLILIASIICGMIFLFLPSILKIKSFLILIIFYFLAFGIPGFTIFWFFCREALIRRDYERNFMFFLRDLNDNVRSGLSIVNALENLTKNDYGRLSSLVKKLYIEVKTGVPFDIAIRKFAKRAGIPLISRYCLIIGESIKAGGNVSDILDALVRSVFEIERLKIERKIFIQSFAIYLYVIYFIFLAIIISIVKYLIPQIISYSQLKIDMKYLKQIMRDLIIIQAIFIGLNIGNISGQGFSVGIKHSITLFISGLIIYSFFVG